MRFSSGAVPSRNFIGVFIVEHVVLAIAVIRVHPHLVEWTLRKCVRATLSVSWLCRNVNGLCLLAYFQLVYAILRVRPHSKQASQSVCCCCAIASAVVLTDDEPDLL